MKQDKVIRRLEKAIKGQQGCKITLAHANGEERMYIPILMSEELFIAVRNGDLHTNGYKIRMIEDIEKIKIDDSFAASSTFQEDVDQRILGLDITNWTTLLTTLEKIQLAVVVESEKMLDEDNRYAVGNIEKVGKKRVGISYYGPDTLWADKKWKIPYEDITCVTIGSPYTDVLSKYLPGSNAGAASFGDVDADTETESEQKSAQDVTAALETAQETVGTVAEAGKTAQNAQEVLKKKDSKEKKSKLESAKDKAKEKIKKIKNK